MRQTCRGTWEPDPIGTPQPIGCAALSRVPSPLGLPISAISTASFEGRRGSCPKGNVPQGDVSVSLNWNARSKSALRLDSEGAEALASKMIRSRSLSCSVLNRISSLTLTLTLTLTRLIMSRRRAKISSLRSRPMMDEKPTPTVD